MAEKKKSLTAPGVYDRGTSWQVKVRRQDAAGQRHSLARSFPYDPAQPAHHPHSRASVFTQAAAWAANERAALRIAKRPARDLIEGQTLGAWLERYEAEEVPSKKGAVQERSICRIIRDDFPELCARPVAELRPADFHSMCDEMSRGTRLRSAGVAPATIARHLAVVSHVFTVAASKWGFSIDNPAQAAQRQRPGVRNARTRTVSADEWAAILDALQAVHPSTRAAIEFLRWTACRRGEAVKLRWEDVDLTSGTAHLRDTKTPKPGQRNERVIPLFEARETLQRLGARKSGPVFANDNGRAISGDSLTQAWERATKRAGIEGATLHDLRHTRTTELADLLPMQKVQRITGHSDPRMLMRYYHPTAEDMSRDYFDQLARRKSNQGTHS